MVARRGEIASGTPAEEAELARQSKAQASKRGACTTLLLILRFDWRWPLGRKEKAAPFGAAFSYSKTEPLSVALLPVRFVRR